MLTNYKRSYAAQPVIFPGFNLTYEFPKIFGFRTLTLEPDVYSCNEAVPSAWVRLLEWASKEYHIGVASQSTAKWHCYTLRRDRRKESNG